MLTRLRQLHLSVVERALVTSSLLALLGPQIDARLHLHATSALGDFADTPHVVDHPGSLALAHGESVDLRYAAFTATERGPRTDVVELLGTFTTDDLLGRAATSMLQTWHSS